VSWSQTGGVGLPYSTFTTRLPIAARDNATVQRMVVPAWRGASPLMLLVLGFVLVGLILQLVQGWVSVAGDSLWLAGFLLVAVAAVTEPKRPRTTMGRTSTVCFALLGLGAAALMAYWILVDSRQIARSGDLYTILLVVIGVVGVLARIAANRTSR
jgi:hypothetical protein